MTYVPIRPILIHAIKFTNFLTPELSDLGFQYIPSNVQFQCNCGHSQNEHIFLNGKGAVCPYNYIIHNNTEITGVMSIDNFETMYKLFEYDDATFTEVTASENMEETE